MCQKREPIIDRLSKFTLCNLINYANSATIFLSASKASTGNSS